MKTISLLSAVIFWSSVALAGKVTIVNSGFTFSPNVVNIKTGDTVVFTLAGAHDAVEVSEATWAANGNTPLPGFSVPFGGGQVTGLAVGTHYFVCSPHASLGMKGQIIVASTLGVNDFSLAVGTLSLYPNPTSGTFVFRYQDTGNTPATGLKIMVRNFIGQQLYFRAGMQPETDYPIDLSGQPAGMYLVTLTDGRQSETRRVVKH